MNEKPKESDWKQFRSMVEFLRERYLKEKNQQLTQILTDTERTSTKQFWDTFEEMKKEGKILEECLDGHSRSRMYMKMLLMLRYGMLKEEDLKGFSDGLQEQLTAYLKRIHNQSEWDSDITEPPSFRAHPLRWKSLP